MNKRVYLWILIAGLTGLFSCGSNPESQIFRVKNRTNLLRDDAFVVIDLKKLELPDVCKKPLVVMLDSQEVPVKKHDGKLYFLGDF